MFIWTHCAWLHIGSCFRAKRGATIAPLGDQSPALGWAPRCGRSGRLARAASRPGGVALPPSHADAVSCTMARRCHEAGLHICSSSRQCHAAASRDMHRPDERHAPACVLPVHFPHARCPAATVAPVKLSVSAACQADGWRLSGMVPFLFTSCRS